MDIHGYIYGYPRKIWMGNFISTASLAMTGDRPRQPAYTGWSKKTDPQFYFWDNFGNSAPILTILSLLQAEIYGA